MAKEGAASMRWAFELDERSICSNLAIRINLESLPRRPIYTVAAQEMLLCDMMQIGRSCNALTEEHPFAAQLAEGSRSQSRPAHTRDIQVMLTRTMFAKLA